MTLEQRIIAFCQLGDILKVRLTSQLDVWSTQAQAENPWFIATNVENALLGVTKLLEEPALRSFAAQYNFDQVKPRTVALIMAGNIPLVGFHDFLCVLLSGHHLMIKFSSKDSRLLRLLIDELLTIEPRFKDYIQVAENQLKGFDAIIATGSDNSARYFDYYFSKYPNIIRKNRTSCAILSGKETSEELALLGNDVFMYFGLGCRNVSKLYIPSTYDLTRLGDAWQPFAKTAMHHKYCNNYDYQKAILLVNQQEHLDFGYLLLQESENLVSPISVLFYERYTSEDDVTNKIINNRSKLQCIVGNEPYCTVRFGKTQAPAITEFADDIDTLQFLVQLP